MNLKTLSYAGYWRGVGIVGIIALITLQNNLKHLIVTDPAPNFVIPVFVLVGYLIV